MYRPGGYSSEDSDDEFGVFGPTIRRPTPAQKPVILPPHEILLKAAQAGDYDTFVSTLEKDDKNGEDFVNYVYTSSRNWSLLMFACSGRNLALIKLLLERGANSNYRSSDGYSPILAMATSHNSNPDPGNRQTLAGIELLVEYGADVKSSERPGLSPINLVCKTNKIEVVKYFLEKGLDVNGKDGNQTTGLHHSAQNGFGKLIRLLLENGADPTIPDQEGYTAYNKAMDNGHQQWASILYLIETTEWNLGKPPSLAKIPKRMISTQEANNIERYTLPEKSQIAMFLQRIQLESLIPLFEEQDINYLTFLRLTDDDLLSIGVQNQPDREAILETIEAIRKAAWNTTAKSHFLKGHITTAEILCMITDVATHTKRVAKNADNLKKVVLENPDMFQVGKESFSVTEIIDTLESSYKSSLSFRDRVLELQALFREGNPNRAELPCKDSEVRKWPRQAFLIPLAAIFGVVLIAGLKKLRT